MSVQAIATLIPTIIGLVSIFTTTGLVSKKYAPLLVLSFGIFLVFLFNGGAFNAETLFVGILTSLSAMGAYSGVKASSKIFTKSEEVIAVQ